MYFLSSGVNGLSLALPSVKSAFSQPVKRREVLFITMFIPHLCHCRRNAWTAKHDATVSRRCWTTWRGKITKLRVASNTSIRACPNKEEWLYIRKLRQPLSAQQNTTDQNIMARTAHLSRMWKISAEKNSCSLTNKHDGVSTGNDKINCFHSTWCVARLF